MANFSDFPMEEQCSISLVSENQFYYEIKKKKKKKNVFLITTLKRKGNFVYFITLFCNID